MTDNQEQHKRHKKPEKKRLDEQQLTTLGEIFPGFAPWYRANYDEQGNLKPEARIPGLTPPEEDENK